MFEDLLLVSPLGPNAVVKALEQVPTAAGDASRALASAVAIVRQSALHSAAPAEAEGELPGSTLGAMQEGSWHEWAAPAGGESAWDKAGLERAACDNCADSLPATVADRRRGGNHSAESQSEEGGRAPSSTEPAAIRIQPANGWDQIVSRRAVSRVPAKGQRWTFGDGTVSLWELVAGVNFQVYAGIHVWALVAVVQWRSWRLVGLCAAMYVLKMFGITGGFHRLLSHRSVQGSWFQLSDERTDRTPVPGPLGARLPVQSLLP